ncbi:MAG: carboxypeptidase-like regulatory domain-containing protein [Vicinamibacterales bacterium]
MVCAIIAVASASAQVPQRDTRKPVAPVANAAPAPEGTGSLAGTVVADASGAPVRLAYVVLIGAQTGVLKVTSTDHTGRFSFAKLPADRYTVGASKLPYLGAVAGARRPARPGVPIVLANGATISDVAIRLPMSAAISGVVYDERGQPAPGVAVSLQQRKMQNGERVLVATGGVVTTDDRGFYRAHGLAPGEYLVTALPLRQGAAGARTLTDAEVDAALRGSPLPPPVASAGNGQNVAYAVVYFPGTTRMNDAQPVLLATAEDRQNIDLRLEHVRTGRVEGTVATSDGQPLPPVTIFISTTAGSSPLTTMSTVRVGPPDGRFGFTSPPGSFTLVARTTGGPGGQFAVAQLDMAGTDVTGVQLILQPPLTVGGRLTAKGTASLPALGGHRIQVQPLSRALGGMAAPQVSATTATGEFTVTGVVPGRYVIAAPFFGAATASVVWGLESVSADGKDITDLPLEITNETMPKDLSVVLTDRWQELSGRLTDAAGAGVSDYTVMVFPVNEAYWVNGSRRVVTMQPGTDGRFTVGGPGPAMLPAGEYYLAAVTDVSKDEQFDPAFLQSLVSASIRVTLRPGEKITQNLRVS